MYDTNEPPPPPMPETFTKPEHPRMALAPVKPRVKIALSVFAVLTAVGAMLFLKSESGREQNAVAEAKMAVANAISATFKGESADATQRALVERVGLAIAQNSDAKLAPTKLKFRLLAEKNAINLYALPTGEIFVTTALVNRMKTEGQLAAALAHGVAHGMVGDAPMPLPNTTPQSPQWNYTLAQEAAADKLALKLMSQAGYDPNAMIGMFSVLAEAYQAKADVAFFITHPNDRDRLTHIQEAIVALYPSGVPAALSK